jgi:hypothetical protein
MRTLILGIIMLFSLLMFSQHGYCAAAAGTFTNGSELTSPPGSQGVETSDTILTWEILADGWSDYAMGGYFWISYTLGDSTTCTLTWYTSQYREGNSDWAIYAPRNASTTIPVVYAVQMPAASTDWIEPIPFPEAIRRVKCVLTITGGTPTDVITVRLIKASR